MLGRGADGDYKWLEKGPSLGVPVDTSVVIRGGWGGSRNRETWARGGLGVRRKKETRNRNGLETGLRGENVGGGGGTSEKRWGSTYWDVRGWNDLKRGGNKTGTQTAGRE